MSRYAVGTDHAPRRRVRPHAVPRRPALPWRQWAAHAFDTVVFLLCMGAALSLLWVTP